MTLHEYRKLCEDVFANSPPEPGAMGEYFTLLLLSNLYRIADESDERTPCLNHWLKLPVDEKLKAEVMRGVKARGDKRQ